MFFFVFLLLNLNHTLFNKIEAGQIIAKHLNVTLKHSITLFFFLNDNITSPRVMATIIFLQNKTKRELPINTPAAVIGQTALRTQKCIVGELVFLDIEKASE